MAAAAALIVNKSTHGLCLHGSRRARRLGSSDNTSSSKFSKKIRAAMTVCGKCCNWDGVERGIEGFLEKGTNELRRKLPMEVKQVEIVLGKGSC